MRIDASCYRSASLCSVAMQSLYLCCHCDYAPVLCDLTYLFYLCPFVPLPLLAVRDEHFSSFRAPCTFTIGQLAMLLLSHPRRLSFPFPYP